MEELHACALQRRWRSQAQSYNGPSEGRFHLINHDIRYQALSYPFEQWKVAAGGAEVTMDEGSASHANPSQNLGKQI